MMDFLKLAQERYSCRQFSAEPVSSDDLNKILEAARLAPSAVNTQSCQLYVVNTPEKMQKMQALRSWFGATALIVVCTPEHASWTRGFDRQNFTFVDLGILLDHMALCATSLGLGSCIMGSFNPKVVRETLQISDDLYPMAVLAVGHPSAEAVPSESHFSRKALQERLIAGSDLS